MGNVLKKYNGTNWEVVGGAVTGDTLPVGSIIPYGGQEAPIGWLMCDGSGLNRETYKELFEAIGTSFGTDGPGNFYIPDLRGRVVVGQDGTDPDFGMGITGGEKTHTLNLGNLPSRTTVAVSYDGGLLSYSEWKGGQVSSGFYNSTLADMQLESEKPFSVVQPYQVTNYIIKAFQSSGVVAQVSNTKSESTTDTYSCDYVNKLNAYSTEEVFTGKYWIDGKPIYKKVFTFTSLENSSDNAVGSINELSSLVAINGWANVGGMLQSLPHSDYRAIEWNIGLAFDWGNKNVVVRKGPSGTVIGNSCVIVEYTKTTD